MNCLCPGYVYIGPGDPFCDACGHVDEDHAGDACERLVVRPLLVGLAGVAGVATVMGW